MEPTQNQKQFLDIITTHQPICDKCCSEKLSYKHNQNANVPCRKLRDLGYIQRIKGSCKGCGRMVFLNSKIK